MILTTPSQFPKCLLSLSDKFQPADRANMPRITCACQPPDEFRLPRSCCLTGLEPGSCPKEEPSPPHWSHFLPVSCPQLVLCLSGLGRSGRATFQSPHRKKSFIFGHFWWRFPPCFSARCCPSVSSLPSPITPVCQEFVLFRTFLLPKDSCPWV